MNPRTVMAAALAAFCVMPSFPSQAFAEETAVPATAPTQAKDDSNAVNILTELIAKDQKAQADVSARIQRLLLDPDFKKRSYVTADLPKDPLAKGIPAMVDKWVAQNPAKAAMLYFVARPQGGKVPAWVLKHPKGQQIFKDDEKCAPLPERLGNYMAGTGQQHAAGSWIEAVGVSGMEKSVSGFLEEAAKGAGVIFDPSVPCTPRKAAENAQLGDKPLDVPQTRPGGGATLDGAASGFSFGDLYEEGAVFTEVKGPKDEGYRRLSVKIYTVPDGKGNFENKIGVVDITDEKLPYGPELIALVPGEKTFELRGGGRKYTLNVEANGDVTLRRPEDKKGEGALTTSIEDLSQKRLDQVAGRGSIDIGGKAYYVLGQGGVKGSLLFFSKTEIDARRPPFDTEARAAADVSEVAANRTRPISTKPGPDMGLIGGKPYHLVFNDELKIWKVTPGPGYKEPVKEPAKEAAAKGSSGGTAKTKGGGGGTTPQPAEGDDQTLEDVVERLKALGFQEPEPDGNEGFSDEMKQVAHILVNPEGEPPFCFVLKPGIRPGNQWCPGEAEDDELKGLRGFDNYGVVEYGNSRQYLSIPFLAGVEKTKHSGIHGKSGMSEVKDVAIALDMLSVYEGYSEADLKVIEERLNKHTDGPFFISGSKEKKMVLIRNVTEKTTYRVWPTEGIGKGDNAGVEDRKGPGTAVDLSFGPDADFQKELPFDATQKMTLQKASEDGGTAVYQMDDAASGEKKWFVLVRATVDGAPSRSGKVQIFGTGKDWNALPASYSLKGYADTEVPRTAKMGLALGEKGKKGALSLYKLVIPAKDGSNVKDKKGNCVGPVVWWGEGVDEAAALKACRAGKF